MRYASYPLSVVLLFLLAMPVAAHDSASRGSRFWLSPFLPSSVNLFRSCLEDEEVEEEEEETTTGVVGSGTEEEEVVLEESETLEESEASVELLALEETEEEVVEEDLEEEETSVASDIEEWVTRFAENVLDLDETETEQFVADFNEIVDDLGVDPDEVHPCLGFKIVLFLALRELLDQADSEVEAAT